MSHWRVFVRETRNGKTTEVQEKCPWQEPMEYQDAVQALFATIEWLENSPIDGRILCVTLEQMIPAKEVAYRNIDIAAMTPTTWAMMSPFERLLWKQMQGNPGPMLQCWQCGYPESYGDSRYIRVRRCPYCALVAKQPASETEYMTRAVLAQMQERLQAVNQDARMGSEPEEKT